METKSASFEEVFHAVYGRHTAIPTICHGEDGKRQTAKWDSYVKEADKPYLKNAHGTIRLVIALLASTIMTSSACTSTHERRYLTATVLRDLINYIIQLDIGNWCALPLHDCALPISHGRVEQAKDALTQTVPGTQVVDWWNSVLAKDITLPISVPLITSPVFRRSRSVVFSISLNLIFYFAGNLSQDNQNRINMNNKLARSSICLLFRSSIAPLENLLLP